MRTLTRDMVLLLTDGREYRIAYAMGSGEWYVLDDTGRNINGGPQ
jgi:hypothetical protein